MPQAALVSGSRIRVRVRVGVRVGGWAWGQDKVTLMIRFGSGLGAG